MRKYYKGDLSLEIVAIFIKTLKMFIPFIIGIMVTVRN